MGWFFGKDKQIHPVDPSVESPNVFDHMDDFTDKNTIQGLEEDDFYELLVDVDTASNASGGGVSSYASRGGPIDLSAIHSSSYVGKFGTPPGNNWIDHAQMVLEGQLTFDPNAYGWFDKPIFDTLEEKFPALVDDEHKDYGDYEVARLNLAVLRNFIYNHLFPDGTFDPDESDKEKIPEIVQMALEVAHMIEQGHNIFPNMLQMNAVGSGTLNEEGIGAAALYENLYSINKGYENTRAFHLVRETFMDYRSRDWKLPRIEETPFGREQLRGEPTGGGGTEVITQDYDAALDAKAELAHMLAQHEHERSLYEAALAAGSLAGFDAMEDVSNNLEDISTQLLSVNDLSQPIKYRAIEIAKEILENLRVEFMDTPVEMLVGSDDVATVRAIMQDVSTVANTYQHHLGNALQIDPDLADDPEVLEASNAVGIFSYQAKQQAANQGYAQAALAERNGDELLAEQLYNRAEENRLQAEAMPESWQSGGGATIGALMTAIENGLDRIVSRMQEKTQDSGLAPIGAMAFGQEEEHGIDQTNQPQPGSVQQNDKKLQRTFQTDIVHDQIQEARRARIDERRAARQQDQNGMAMSKRSNSAKAAGVKPPKPAPSNSSVMQQQQSLGNILPPDVLKMMNITMKGDVPDELAPNSAARTISKITKQKSALRDDLLRDQQDAREQGDAAKDAASRRPGSFSR